MQDLMIDLTEAQWRRLEHAAAKSGMTVDAMARAELERRYRLQHTEGVVVALDPSKGATRGHD